LAFELKHDGFRALALLQNGKCRLISRNGNELHSFSALSGALPKELKVQSAVLDGEMVCLDEKGYFCCR
jgi:bifunctional non-homologous end joining protein LigD